MPLDARVAKAIDPVNQRNLKRVENGGSIGFVQAKNVVLIGDGHVKSVVDSVQQSVARNNGTITVKREMIGKGEVEVAGCRDRAEFEATIHRISKKKVIFR